MDTVVLTVSNDLPFAQILLQGRGYHQRVTLSQLRDRAFGVILGSRSLMAHWLAFITAVVVADKAGNVIYTQQVPEIVQEPDYTAVLDAVR